MDISLQHGLARLYKKIAVFFENVKGAGIGAREYRSLLLKSDTLHREASCTL